MACMLDTLEIFNWGVYTGAHNIKFAPTTDDSTRSAVCLTGDTGSGKTTIGDAYLSIIKPKNADASYNAASNGGIGAHRERRTTISYIRGDVGKDANNNNAERRLRPQDVVNSAVIGKFITDNGDYTWCGRIMQYFSGDEKLRQIWIISTTQIDLNQLNKAIGTNELSTKVVNKAISNVTTFDSVSRYELHMGEVLGIGHDSATIENVTKLLAMVQGEKAPSNTDTLFKEYVLDNVDVRSKIAHCIESIESENERVQGMELTRYHIQGLKKLQDAYDEFDQTTKQEKGLTELINDNTFRNWSNNVRRGIAEMETAHFETLLQTKQEELEQIEDQNQQLTHAYQEAYQQHLQAASDAEKAATEELKAKTQAVDIATAHTNRLRADIKSTEKEIETEETTIRFSTDKLSDIQQDLMLRQTLLDNAYQAVKEFVKDVKKPNDETSWDQMLQQTESYDTTQETRLRDEKEDLIYEQRDVRTQIDQMLADLAKREQRKTRMPSDLIEVRDEIAQAIGLEPYELPYVAELIDMADDQEEWRIAANCAFGGLLKRMLVNQENRYEVQRLANRIASNRGKRINYDVVDTDDDRIMTPSSDGIVAKLEFDESSEFIWHIKRLLTSLDHICIDDIRNVPQNNKKRYVAKDGQTFSGTRGTFGRTKNFDTLGFENQSQLEDMRAEIEDLENDQNSIKQKIRRVNAQISSFEQRAKLAAELRRTRWSTIDPTEDTQKITELKQDITQHQANVEQLYTQLKEQQTTVQQKEAELAEITSQLQQAEADIQNKHNKTSSPYLLEAEKINKQREQLLAQKGIVGQEIDQLTAMLATAKNHLEKYADATCPNMSATAINTLTNVLNPGTKTPSQWAIDQAIDDSTWTHLYNDVDSNLKSIAATITREHHATLEKIQNAIEKYDACEHLMPYVNENIHKEDWLYDSLSGSAWDEVSKRRAELNLEHLSDSDPQGHILLSWKCYYQHELSILETEWGDIDIMAATRAMCSTSLNSLASLQAIDGTLRREVRKRIKDVNQILMNIALSDDTDHFLEVCGTVSRNRDTDTTFKTLSKFAKLNVNLTDTTIDFNDLRQQINQFAQILKQESDPKRKCFLDPRDYINITFIEHHGDMLTTHSGTGKLSGGEMQQMSACIVGAALLYVMGADTKNGPAYKTIMLDEAFVKSDDSHARSTLRVLMRMGFKPIVAMPPTIVMSVSECLSKMLFVTKSRLGTSEVHESTFLQDIQSPNKEIA